MGSLADEDIYIESAGDRAEKEELEKDSSKKETAPAPEKQENTASETAPAENIDTSKPEEATAQENADTPAEPVIQYSEYKPESNNNN